MNKKTWIIIAIVIVLLVGGGIFFYVRNSSSAPNRSNYEVGKTSTNESLKQEKENNNQKNKNQEEQESQGNFSGVDTNDETKQGITEAEDNPSPTIEEQIATFSTKIYTKDSSRQNNISITCNTLNETIVKNGSTFSFCNTVGQASTSKGYQKAEIFDKNGNKKQGLGGRKLSN